MKNKYKITIGLPQTLGDELKNISNNAGISITATVRLALREYVLNFKTANFDKNNTGDQA